MINKVILLGHVGKDPEVRHLDNDRTVARLTIATNETYRNKSGEKVTNTEWHNVVAWRALAEITEKYIKKGSLLYIEGKLRTRSWDDKDGNKRYTTEIEAENIQMVGRRPEDGGQQPNAGIADSGSSAEPTGGFEYPTNTGSTSSATDDLPF